MTTLSVSSKFLKSYLY